MGSTPEKILAIMDECDCARATAFKKQKEGYQPDLEAFVKRQGERKAKGEPTDGTLPANFDQPIEWARAVLWAAEHQNHKGMTRRKAGSGLNFTLWEFGQSRPKELLVQMVPKAIDIITGDGGDKAGSEYELVENQSIAELEELLVAAVAESKRG